MKRSILIMLIGVILNMAAFTNTIKGFMPGNIDRQTVTQEPGTFGRYKEEASNVLNKKTGEPYMDMSFVRSFDDRPFDIEKASEMPIKPNIQLTNEQKMERFSNPAAKDDRPHLRIKLGPKTTKLARFKLPQRR